MASTASFHHSIRTLLGLIAIVSATCYLPDGTAKDSAYQPCNGSVPVSMCCHLGVGNNNGDACGSGSSYGLCGVTGAQLWRESCTDPTWTSPLCLKLCINGASDQMITACPDGSYCCGANNATCCSAGHGQFIVNNAVSNTSSTSSSASSSTSSLTSSLTPSLTLSSTPSSAASSSTAPASNSPAAFASTTTPAPSSSTPSASIAPSAASSSSGSSSSTIIGLSVGIAVAVLAAAFFAGMYFWKRKRKPDIHKEESAGVVNAGNGLYRGELGFENMPMETDGKSRAEMDGGALVMGYGMPQRAADLPVNTVSG